MQDWIRQHNEDPDRVKLKNKDQLLASHKELAVEKKTGGRIVAPKRQFVTQSAWDEAKYGKYDASKETELEYKGVRHKGVWRCTGSEGVFDLEDYEDTAVAEKTVEHGLADSDQPFAEQAFERKKEALQAALGTQARLRDANAVKGPDLSLEHLMALVSEVNTSDPKARSSKDRPSARSRSPSGGSDGHSSSSSSSDPQSSEDEAEHRLSSLSLLTAPTKKSQAKAAAAGSKAASSNAPAASSNNSKGSKNQKSQKTLDCDCGALLRSLAFQAGLKVEEGWVCGRRLR